MLKKTFIFFLFCTFFTLNTLHAAELHSDFDKILKTYVSQGMVDYKGIKSNRAALDAYLNNMGKVTKATFNTWNKNDQLAYLINLYNAATLQLIIDNYPLKSIKDIGSIFSGPWSKEFVQLFGKAVTLDNIEHDIIRKEYFEPRIHLALVCAAKSCPQLRSEAYQGNILSKQLDQQGEQFFSSPQGIKIDHANKKVYLSSILKWYKEDFASVTAFAQKYTKDNFNNYKLDWLDYDWQLNEK